MCNLSSWSSIINPSKYYLHDIVRYCNGNVLAGKETIQMPRTKTAMHREASTESADDEELSSCACGISTVR